MARASSSASLVETYPAEARRPLHVLLFVLPMVVVYEASLLILLPRHPDVLPNLAHEGVLRFFSTFGVGGWFLPGIVLVAVLVAWQVLSREPWRPRWAVPWIMALESLVLAMPLLVLGQIVQRTLPLVAAPVEERIVALDLWGRLVISLGAGLYEEFIFRMLLIAVIHTLLVDVLRLGHAFGAAVAVVVSAAIFAWCHPLAGPDGLLSMQRLAFFLLAGLYFGALFVMRGFGIAVGAHVAYDGMVSIWLIR
ncbi:MAG TPA: CPBP family glutamic-type intramembrane protease [Phycisphaerales bacterium]|nr:CPBP family glutamic-type intramembrane protease [Phycisphaerales bacterium]HMP37629.1 CPBP family glutamic-type intramembrane protease [Phycisphaerales bacterium]